MCFSSSAPKSTPLPPVAPAAPKYADAGVQQAATDAKANASQASGLGGTQLTGNLSGQGKGATKLAGGARTGGGM